ncbi:MAG TPA: Asp23/Gls24 family envelope stress response protein [Clostridia bacterium]|nr:Asp23/Gls24 family envelope stress response protein [Clostridia bacterium]HRX42491.1 Asp23/Gls24 family envelope stress response protein [Clostridia bacterium]
MSGSEIISSGEEYGQLKISNEVIAIIAGLAAVEVDGVYSMSGGLTGGIAEVLGIRNLSKGIRVETKEDKVYINIYIIAEFGARIPEVAWNIQETVKKTVERMTGMKVMEANIHVQSVNIPRE